MPPDKNEPVILGGARTPFGRFQGTMASLTSIDLGAHAIRAALERSRLPATAVDAVIIGQVLQAGTGQGPARQSSIKAGISWETPTVTINKLCLSGLTAVIDGARLIRAGEADFVVAAGQESMTNAPHLHKTARKGTTIGDTKLVDSINFDGLQDPFDGSLMGAATDQGNITRHISRKAQDEVAARSHQRAEHARVSGVFANEIAPLSISSRGKELLIEHDEGIRPDASYHKLAALKPAFSHDPQATITAGSSSPLSDGAAAVVLANRRAAQAAGLTWLAEIGAHGQTAGPDSSLHSQPAQAIKSALKKEHLQINDLDLIEINEAFASVLIQSANDLGLEAKNINLNGGAIALGHPIGSSGTRLVLHQALELQRTRKKIGTVALCGGGGQGEALVLKAANTRQ